MSDEEQPVPAADVLQLGVKFKAPVPEDRFLIAPPLACSHYQGPFLVDDKLAEVTCGRCNAKLSPMWVLTQLMHKESNWHAGFERYQDEMKRLAERSRTKCQHCGKMTRISQT